MRRGSDANSALESLLVQIRQRSEAVVAELEDAQRASKSLSQQLEVIGREHELMANLYVQLRRIHASLQLRDVVAALGETLSNLVGTEDFALFLYDDDTRRYERVSEMGAGAEVPGFALGEGTLGSAAATHTIVYGETLAAVPLGSALGRGVMGMIVIVRLLAHKAGLVARDRALLEVFAEHAGVAIEAALCAAAVGVPRTSAAEVRAHVEGAIPPLLALERK
jgi:hypothetical protein